MRFGVSTEKQEELQRKMEELGIREEDLVERFVRGGGPGGQKINKTAVAVYLQHVPSGTEVKVQEGRSQARNRFFARRRLIELLEEKIEGRRSARQQAMEKIRRQKRRRSRRAKAKTVAEKRKQGEKKAARQSVRRDDD